MRCSITNRRRCRNAVAVITLFLTGRAVLAWWRRGSPRAHHRWEHQVTRPLRQARGWCRHAAYVVQGGHLDPHVPDLVLADRLRSRLGPLEKRLDIPRVHVTVVDHHVLLHGCVGTAEEAAIVGLAVQAEPGVASVTNRLHVGLGDADERPSEGRRHRAPSPALQRLVDAAAQAAGSEDEAWPPVAVAAVLTTLLSVLPPTERDQFLGHLPADVRALATPSRRHRIRHADDFIAAVAAADTLNTTDAPPVVAAVLATLRDLAPEEAHDVASVLPVELAELWWSAVG